jgi:hypothetical protein
MKKLVFLILVVCLACSFSLFAGGKAEKQDEIRIGFYGPLTGPMSLNKSMRRAAFSAGSLFWFRTTINPPRNRL